MLSCAADCTWWGLELATYANCTARAVNRATRDMMLLLKKAGPIELVVVDPKEYVVSHLVPWSTTRLP